MDAVLRNLGLWMENLSPFMSFLTVLWVVTIIAFRKTLANKIKNFDFKRLWVFGKNKRFKKIILLKDHDLFNVIERVRNQIRLKKFYTGGEVDIVKSKMFIDFMNFYLDATRTCYKEFFLDKTLSSLSADELKSDVFTLLNKTKKVAAERSTQHFIARGIPDKDAAHIINLFEQWRNETYVAVDSRINGIFSSEFHSDNFERLLACLEIISMSIDLIPKDGVETFEKMNGRFKNLIY